jgi:hypothetical protein
MRSAATNANHRRDAVPVVDVRPTPRRMDRAGRDASEHHASGAVDMAVDVTPHLGRIRRIAGEGCFRLESTTPEDIFRLESVTHTPLVRLALAYASIVPSRSGDLSVAAVARQESKRLPLRGPQGAEMALIEGENVSSPVALGQHHDGSVSDAETQGPVFAKHTTSCR